MAETKKTTQNTEEKVFVKLRRSSNPNAPQEEFFSYNFHNYIIKRGEEVEIPIGLAEMIKDNEEAEDFAFRYASEVALKESK